MHYLPASLLPWPPACIQRLLPCKRCRVGPCCTSPKPTQSVRSPCETGMNRALPISGSQRSRRCRPVIRCHKGYDEPRAPRFPPSGTSGRTAQHDHVFGATVTHGVPHDPARPSPRRRGLARPRAGVTCGHFDTGFVIRGEEHIVVNPFYRGGDECPSNVSSVA